MKKDLKQWRIFSSCAIAALALAGCQREATGQVAAVVNDEEITLQEINAELGNTQIPAGVDRKLVQQAALQRIIERRLAAQVAVKDGIDRDPEYLMRKRQLDEALLVQSMAQKLTRSSRAPDQAAIDKYIAAHGPAFADRVLYKVDRLQFPMPADPSTLREFEADHSMSAVIARLTAKKIPFNRTATQMNSAQVPPAVLGQIRALPAGEPFVVPENGAVAVGVITGSAPAPITGEAARPIAVQMMRNEDVSKTIADRLKAARDTAKIEYQPGFAPPSPNAAASGAAKPAPKK